MAKYQHLMMEEVMCDMLVVLTLIPRHTPAAPEGETDPDMLRGEGFDKQNNPH